MMSQSFVYAQMIIPNQKNVKHWLLNVLQGWNCNGLQEDLAILKFEVI